MGGGGDGRGGGLRLIEPFICKYTVMNYTDLLNLKKKIRSRQKQIS